MPTSLCLGFSPLNLCGLGPLKSPGFFRGPFRGFFRGFFRGLHPSVARRCRQTGK